MALPDTTTQMMLVRSTKGFLPKGGAKVHAKLTNDIMAAREATLEAARQHLKQRFIGVDNTIDQLIEGVKLWWIAPEMLQRPVVINIYGMTGVGKTDIVRELAKCLTMQHRMFEFDMNNASDHSHNATVVEAFDEVGLDDGEPGIVLFDEMQRFNTIGSMGSDVKDTKLADFWELLSDGKIPQRERDKAKRAIEVISGYMDDDELDGPPTPRLRKKISSRGVRLAYGVLRRSHTRAQLAGMSVLEVINLLRNSAENPIMHEPIDYTKLLIILAGNLDNAFPGATSLDDADLDADTFKANVDEVTVVDIKQALAEKFRPEQISRFGLNYIICSTLSRAAFVQLINRELERSCSKLLTVCGIAVTYTPEFVDFVYRNGVFPVQGVRPVFATISSLFDNVVLPRVVAEKQRSHCAAMSITYDETTKEIVMDFLPARARKGGKVVAGKTERVTYHGQLDTIRDKIDADTTAATAVHEAAHAVAVMVLTGVAPIQLSARTAAGSGNGFTLSHAVTNTERALLDRITVLMAGVAGEELVFGAALRGSGHGDDLMRATRWAAAYVRQLGFGSLAANYAMDEHEYTLTNPRTDAAIEACVRKQSKAALTLLKKHKPLLLDIANQLAVKGKLMGEETAEIAKKHKLSVRVVPQNEVLRPGYAKMLADVSKPARSRVAKTAKKSKARK